VPPYIDIFDAVSNRAEDLAVAAGTEPTTIFYTGLQDSQVKAICWARANPSIANKNFIAFFNSLRVADDMDCLNQAAGILADINHMQQLISRAMGQTADGIVFPLIPQGVQPHPQSTWMLYDFPAIQHDNVFALEVVRVDPATGSTQRIWQRGDTPTSSVLWTRCVRVLWLHWHHGVRRLAAI
jgi:hypothetical protein